MFQLVLGVIIAVLIVIYMWLRKSMHREENLPAMSQPNLLAVSEDVNLPAKPEESSNNHPPAGGPITN